MLSMHFFGDRDPVSVLCNVQAVREHEGGRDAAGQVTSASLVQVGYANFGALLCEASSYGSSKAGGSS